MPSFRIIFISILFLLLFLEIWLGFPVHLEWGAEEAQIDISQLKKNSDIEKRMEGVHLAESRAGSKDWELYSESAEGYGGSGSWKLKKVKVLFYNEDRVQFTVLGNTGTIDSKTKDMEISGDVLIQSPHGHKIQTHSMNYLSEVRKIKSPGKVKMLAPSDLNGKSMLVEGNWFDSEVDKNIMRIHQNVTAQKKLSDGRTLFVKSNEAEFYGNERTAKFVDHVSIEVDSMKIEGPEAQFQYKDGVSALQSVLVKGGVQVSDLDKYATSDLIRFDPSENRFTLTGKPRVVQNNDEILGDQIIFIDGGKKVKVQNMKARVEKTED